MVMVMRLTPTARILAMMSFLPTRTRMRMMMMMMIMATAMRMMMLVMATMMMLLTMMWMNTTSSLCPAAPESKNLLSHQAAPEVRSAFLEGPAGIWIGASEDQKKE